MESRNVNVDNNSKKEKRYRRTFLLLLLLLLLVFLPILITSWTIKGNGHNSGINTENKVENIPLKDFEFKTQDPAREEKIWQEFHRQLAKNNIEMSTEQLANLELVLVGQAASTHIEGPLGFQTRECQNIWALNWKDLNPDSVAKPLRIINNWTQVLSSDLNQIAPLKYNIGVTAPIAGYEKFILSELAFELQWMNVDKCLTVEHVANKNDSPTGALILEFNVVPKNQESIQWYKGKLPVTIIMQAPLD